MDKTELAALAAEMAVAAPSNGRRRGGRDDDDDVNPARLVSSALSFDADRNGQLDQQELEKFAQAFAQRGRRGRGRD